MKKVARTVNVLLKVMIIASFLHDEGWKHSNGKHYGDIDIAIAVEHLCLAATEQRAWHMLGV